MTTAPADQQLTDEIFQQSSYSWSIGPLTVTASIDLSAPSVTVSATLLGANIGSVTLNPSNTTASIGGSVGGFTAEVDVTMDFSDLELTISAKACAPLVGCKSGSTQIQL